MDNLAELYVTVQLKIKCVMRKSAVCLICCRCSLDRDLQMARIISWFLKKFALLLLLSHSFCN